jgi:hypothetical protein
MQVKNPLQNLIPKEKTQWSINWVGSLEFKVSTKPIVSQSFSTRPINIIMYME